jgi:hypothetical protein
MANSAVPRMSPAMFAPTSVRSRKIENGMSGSRVRDSQPAKAASSTSEAANRPIVSAEPQPRSLAWVIA